MKINEAKRFLETHQEPALNDRGWCSKCIGGLCEYHQAEGLIRWHRREAALHEAAVALRVDSIGRIMVDNRLESDEGGTAYQKAERIQAGLLPISNWHIISGI